MGLFALKEWFEYFFLPPGIQCVLLLIALLCRKKWAKISFGLALTAGLSLYILSTPWGRYLLLSPLDDAYPFLPPPAQIEQAAVVVLSGGQKRIVPRTEPQLALSGTTLSRLMYGIALARRYHLPIWLSGGGHWPDGIREADGMSRIITSETRIQDWHLDRDSRNTEENSIFTLAQIQKTTIRHILLVTDAWHMPRSFFWFEHEGRKYGMKITAAPLPKGAPPKINQISTWLPNLEALGGSTRALREYAAWAPILLIKAGLLTP